MERRGFTALEVMLVIGVLAVLAAISIPMYRRFLARSELAAAAEQITQALSRAQLLSQTAQGDSSWGFNVEHAVLFQGETYDTRVPGYDELYPVPQSIEASGLGEITYSKLQGAPSITGSIVLATSYGELLTVNIIIPSEGVPVIDPDRLTICHCQANPPHTLTIPDSAWPAHQRHGDSFGACEIRPDPCES